jgi:UDP-N-acetylglucosamine 2-epimerase (non-hydrolysing)
VRDAAFVLTDSGGLQEESTALGVPCLTLRDRTERPATVEQGSNRVVGTQPEAIVAAARQALRGDWSCGRLPELWDGHAADRIASILAAEAERIHSLYRALRARTTACRTVSASAA